MKVGFMGLGKLGLPCALAVERAGHVVVGHDPSPQVAEIIASRKLPYREFGAQELLDNTKITLVSVEDLVEQCDILFVAVQTPHNPKYEGVTRLPTKRVDFDYTYLKAAIAQIVSVAEAKQRVTSIIVVSTVLPGTVDREIRPMLGSYVKLCYDPFFIAMGTTIHDFTHPEFVLFGVDDPATADIAEAFYKTIHDRPFYRTTIRNAELIKVAYNTFISTKIAFVNTLMEVCQKTGCDVDAVTDALKMATDRLISPKYMTAGMGDGGGCHPRDNIALSWLARELDLGFDLFEAIMLQREKQTDWFADLIEDAVNVFTVNQGYVPTVFIMGKAFKPETNLTVGSPSRLLEAVLRERNVTTHMIDPIVDAQDGDHVGAIELLQPILTPGVFFIGTKHQAFANLKFPEGSVVLDPHRYVPDQTNVSVLRIGEGKK